MKKILIANRGEIVLRVIQTCRRLGVKTVAVYSEPDENSPHMCAADESYPLGGSEAKESYLDGGKIIQIAKDSQCDAIHPGYGFLSENPEFAETVVKSGLIFIGPTPQTMRLLGHKHTARKTAVAAGAPVIPGYEGKDQSLQAFLKEGKALGAPLMIKASAGGGGKGMRLVEDLKNFEEAFHGAKREALAFFADDHLILEKVIDPARHIEVQLFGDTHGNVIHLFERDCSLQRRQQKILEETPAPNIKEALLSKIHSAAVLIGKEAHLSNATTVEFLLGKNDDFYFLEANCRLQVEHPVTEMVTGLDLVELQLKAAKGEPLPLKQSEVKRNGAAIETRIYAELPGRNFAPSSGRIVRFSQPEHLSHMRFDHALEEGLAVSTFYDPMLGKMITWGKTRDEALQVHKEALEQLVLLGVENNISFLLALIRHPEVVSGGVSTTFLRDALPQVLDDHTFDTIAPLAVISHVIGEITSSKTINNFDPFQRESLWRAQSGSQPYVSKFSGVVREFSCRSVSLGREKNISLCINEFSPQPNDTSRFTMTLGNEKKHVIVTSDHFEIEGENYHPHIFRKQDGSSFVAINGLTSVIEKVSDNTTGHSKEESSPYLLSPLPGTVVSLRAKVGQEVSLGEILVVIESMKMEHALLAKYPSRIKEVLTLQGKTVKEGDVLVILEAIS